MRMQLVALNAEMQASKQKDNASWSSHQSKARLLLVLLALHLLLVSVLVGLTNCRREGGLIRVAEREAERLCVCVCV